MSLFKTDFVVYDKAKDNVLQDSYGRIIIFGERSEAEADLCWNEIAIPCTELPVHWQKELINQINN